MIRPGSPPRSSCVARAGAFSVSDVHSAPAMPAAPPALGRHLMLDVHAADAALLDSPRRLRARLVAVARAAGATVVGTRFRRFEPHGVTGVVLLAESHIGIHTWPERRFAALDVFTCGDPRLCEAVAAALAGALGAETTRRIADERRGLGG